MRSRPAPLLLRRPSSTRPEAPGLWGATRTIHGADEGSALGFVAAFRPVLLAALGVVYKEVVPDADDAAYRAFVAVLAADIQQDAIERALAAVAAPGSPMPDERYCNFSPDYLAAKPCNGQTATSGLCSLPLDQYLPSPRPSGGSLVIIGPGIGLPGPIAFLGAEGRL
jgi:hypothetical protein